MNLVVDCGNTRLKAALFSSGQLVEKKMFEKNSGTEAVCNA